jgi:hypothetical protein
MNSIPATSSVSRPPADAGQLRGPAAPALPYLAAGRHLEQFSRNWSGTPGVGDEGRGAFRRTAKASTRKIAPKKKPAIPSGTNHTLGTPVRRAAHDPQRPFASIDGNAGPCSTADLSFSCQDSIGSRGQRSLDDLVGLCEQQGWHSEAQ